MQNGRSVNSDWLPPGAAPPPTPLPMPAFLAVLSQALQSVAVDLRPYGVAEVGFRVHPALMAIDELAALGLAILGGDVWETRDGTEQPSYDNWHADRAAEESWDAYVGRAADHARDRIAFFDSIQPQGGRALFVLVADTEGQYDRLMAGYGHPDQSGKLQGRRVGRRPGPANVPWICGAFRYLRGALRTRGKARGRTQQRADPCKWPDRRRHWVPADSSTSFTDEFSTAGSIA